jgi:3-dehydroquinate synthase
MSSPLAIQSYRGTYRVHFIESALATLASQTRESDHFIVDATAISHFPELAHALQDRHATFIAASEEAKSFSAIEPLIARLLDLGFTKSQRLVAIGGGTIQDITAFTASILFRGVDWLFFPTTLLAQCDSCIGSKTSINFGVFKNQLGGFFPPREIFIDQAFLATLPEHEIRSGVGEMLHYFLVNGEEDLKLAEAHIDEALAMGPALQTFLLRSLQIKAAMIERDEFDQGPRNVFNYGHSFGHALESATRYAVAHGIAVSFGMDLANAISVERGWIAPDLRQRLRAVLQKVWQDFEIPPFDLQDYFAALARDKKNEGRDIKVILTRGVGAMLKTSLDLNDDLRGFIADFFGQRRYAKSA